MLLSSPKCCAGFASPLHSFVVSCGALRPPAAADFSTASACSRADVLSIGTALPFRLGCQGASIMPEAARHCVRLYVHKQHFFFLGKSADFGPSGWELWLRGPSHYLPKRRLLHPSLQLSQGLSLHAQVRHGHLPAWCYSQRERL